MSYQRGGRQRDVASRSPAYALVDSTQHTVTFWSARCGSPAYFLLLFCSEFIIVTFIICYVPAIRLPLLIHMLRVLRTPSLNVICPYFYHMLLLFRPRPPTSPFFPDGSGAAPPFFCLSVLAIFLARIRPHCVYKEAARLHRRACQSIRSTSSHCTRPFIPLHPLSLALIRPYIHLS